MPEWTARHSTSGGDPTKKPSSRTLLSVVFLELNWQDERRRSVSDRSSSPTGRRLWWSFCRKKNKQKTYVPTRLACALAWMELQPILTDNDSEWDYVNGRWKEFWDSVCFFCCFYRLFWTACFVWSRAECCKYLKLTLQKRVLDPRTDPRLRYTCRVLSPGGYILSTFMFFLQFETNVVRQTTAKPTRSAGC